MKDYKRNGRLIAAARKAAGLTQIELAIKLGCTDGYVAMMEIGRRCPSYAMACVIDDLLGTSLAMVCPTCGAEKQNGGQ